MKSSNFNASEQLAALDIKLVSALYRAAGEPEAYDNLVAMLEQRYQPDSPAAKGSLREAVVEQLGTINTIVSEQDMSLSHDPLERAVQEVPTAAIVIDPYGKIILTNEIGQVSFRARPGEKFDLGLIDPVYRQRFDDFIASARLRGNQRRIIVRLDAEYVPGNDTGSATVELAEAMIVESARRDHGCIALRTLEIPWTDLIDNQLCEAFGLTEAECEIAREFYRLKDTRTVAQHRGTSLATVQTQLKSIYAKTQTSSQAQLLQVLSLLAARAALDKRSQVAAWSNPIGREASVLRRDGNDIAYSWQGAKDGQPVLVVHGHTLGHIFPPEADRIYREAGLKLYLVSRPGFGHSGLNTSVTSAEDAALTIIDFCRELGLHHVPVLTISSGLIGLSEALDEVPELVSSIMHLGYLWFNEVPLARSLPRHQRLVFKLADRAPRLLKTFSRIADRNMRRVGIDWYIDKVLGDRAHDTAYFRSGENAGLIRAAAGHVLAQGPDIYARELPQPRKPAFDLLRQSRLPTMLALPEHDTIHEFDDYAKALSLNESVRLELLRDSGELYFYKSAETIARLAIQHFAKTAPGYEFLRESVEAKAI
ncbi:MAG: hypothetical protein WBA51_13665 [Erythrobacter sp.]